MLRNFLIIACFILPGFYHSLQAQSWHATRINIDGPVYSLYSDSGTLYIGGRFVNVNDSFCGNSASWSNFSLAQLGMPMGADNSMLGTNSDVLCWQRYNNYVYTGGMFTKAEGYNIKYISYLYAREFYALGKIPDQLDGTVRCMAVYKGELYAGGDFTKSGTTFLNHVGRWDGKSWKPIGNGTDNTVRAMTVYHDHLIIGGDFDSAGSVSGHHIAAWDGMVFSSLGIGFYGDHLMDSLHQVPTVFSLAEFNNQLYAGGFFRKAGDTTAMNMARWNDSTWKNTGKFGNRQTDQVKCLAVYNNRLFAGGIYRKIDDSEVNNIAAWDGTQWRPLSSGADSSVESLNVYNEGLIVGGTFLQAGGISAGHLARWQEHTSGINSFDPSKSKFVIYPNPTRGLLYLKNTEPGKFISYRITNTMGQVIEYGFLNSGQEFEKIDFSSREEGIYFVTCYNNNDIETIPVVVKR
jgi:hypothetical protein